MNNEVVELLDPRAVQIYTDGSCYKNPGGDSGCAAIVRFPEHLIWQIEVLRKAHYRGDSGCAAIVRFPEHLNLPDEQIVDFGCDESSINRMELMACVEALRWVVESGPW